MARAPREEGRYEVLIGGKLPEGAMKGIALR
jgi:hypothetical protein